MRQEEIQTRVFQDRVLKMICGPKRDEVTGNWRNCMTCVFVICVVCHVLLG